MKHATICNVVVYSINDTTIQASPFNLLPYILRVAHLSFTDKDQHITNNSKTKTNVYYVIIT